MIDKNTRMSEIKEFSGFSDFLMYKSVVGGKTASEQTLGELQEQIPSWNAENMAKGLRRLQECQREENTCFNVYEEAQDDPQKQDVKIWHLPAGKKTEIPFIIMASGGSYTSVCSAVESFPAAAEFNKLGYDVFVLNYRVGGEGLLPKPLEDLAAAYQYIVRNKERFRVGGEYIVCGFSAGANLACLWGTESAGYKRYQIRKPEALILAYPLVSFRYMYEETKEELLTTILGRDIEQEKADQYDAARHITADYPSSYIVHCMDDSAVPAEGAKQLKELLDKHWVPVKLEIGREGGHGFGSGEGTKMEGWPERAAEFVQK